MPSRGTIHTLCMYVSDTLRRQCLSEKGNISKIGRPKQSCDDAHYMSAATNFFSLPSMLSYLHCYSESLGRAGDGFRFCILAFPSYFHSDTQRLSFQFFFTKHQQWCLYIITLPLCFRG